MLCCHSYQKTIRKLLLFLLRFTGCTFFSVPEDRSGIYGRSRDSNCVGSRPGKVKAYLGVHNHAPGISGIQTNFARLFSNIQIEMARNANRERLWFDHAK